MIIVKDFNLNIPQAKALTVNANKNWIVWGRATGKTTGVLGPKSLDLVMKMPRGKGGFIGKDYEQIYDRTLPEIVSVWEQLGYYQDKHWRIGKPLDWWDKPIIPPLKWDHVISWYNGVAIHLLSLAVKGAGNGLSLQWLMGDEGKFWKQAALKEILKALRGLPMEFGHLAEYLGYWFATDKWTDDVADIQWILDKKKQMDPQLVEVIYSLQLQINEMRAGYADLPEHEQDAVDSQVARIEKILTPLRKKCVHFVEASAEQNLVVLGKQYLPSQQADLSEEEFNVAILNKDPKKSRSSFYPALNEQVHYYEADNDVAPTLPLVIAGDYQASISPICVAQYANLPSSSIPSLNMVRGPFTLHPQGLEEACLLFVETFKQHMDKIVYYVHDHTAIGRNPFGKTYAELVMETIGGQGWAIIPIYTGKSPDHGIKYERIKQFHANTDPNVYPLIRYNRRHNEACIISMERARAIQTGKETRKDKRHEDTFKYPEYPQQYATHFSDANDQLLWATHELHLVPIFQRAAPFVGSLR